MAAPGHTPTLSAELWLRILELLELQDVYNCVFVCRYLKELAYSGPLYQSITNPRADGLGRNPHLVPKCYAFFSQHPEKAALVKHMDSNSWFAGYWTMKTTPYYEDLAKLCGLLPNVQQVEIAPLALTTSIAYCDALISNLTRCTSLRRISLCNDDITREDEVLYAFDDVLLLLGMPSLIELHLHRIVPIQEYSPQSLKIKSGLRSLTIEEINWYGLPEGRSQLGAVLDSIDGLKQLILGDEWDEYFEDIIGLLIKHQPNLEDVQFDGALKPFRSLRGNAAFIEDSAYSPQWLAAFNHLKHLSFSSEHLLASDLSSISSTCRGIRIVSNSRGELELEAQDAFVAQLSKWKEGLGRSLDVQGTLLDDSHNLLLKAACDDIGISLSIY